MCVWGGGGVVWVCTMSSRYNENAWRERLEICHSGSLGHCIEVYRSWFQKDKGQGHWVIIPTWRFWDPSIPSERLKIGPSYLIHTLNRTIASIVCQFTPYNGAVRVTWPKLGPPLNGWSYVLQILYTNRIRQAPCLRMKKLPLGAWLGSRDHCYLQRCTYNILYNVEIWTLITISLHENSTNLHLQRVYIPSIIVGVLQAYS